MHKVHTSKYSDTKPFTLNIGLMVFNTALNQFDVVNTIRLYGAAQMITNFATSPSYLTSFGISDASTLWDGQSDWNGLKVTNNVVASFGLKNVNTIFVPGSTIPVIEIIAQHSDTVP